MDLQERSEEQLEDKRTPPPTAQRSPWQRLSCVRSACREKAVGGETSTGWRSSELSWVYTLTGEAELPRRSTGIREEFTLR